MRTSWTAAAVTAAVSGCMSAALAGGDVPAGIAAPQEHTTRALARMLIGQLPAEERAQIRAAEGLGAKPAEGAAPLEGIIKDDRYERLRDYVSAELFLRMHDGHISYALLLADAIEGRAEAMPSTMCFAPDADAELVRTMEEMLSLAASEGGAIAFQQIDRWSANALAINPGTSAQGDPVTITYSYVPDGTFVPNLIGFQGNSNLFAWLNGIYGSPAVWQPIFDQVFARWAELTGTSYVFEPNDDGVTLNGAFGQVGVRGDVRIAAIPLDGNSGTLAYNNFPNDGDMVFDSADSFYNNTFGNSLRLRNIIAHEHGHGLGMLHVCPANETKLMEPFISTAYDGPQLDDILNGQRHYGDDLEPNDGVAQATQLGVLNTPSSTAVTNISVDGTSDQDYFDITVNGPAALTVTATPSAGVYDQGPQTPGCGPAGNITDYNAQNLLIVDLIGLDGSTVLATALAPTLGQPAQLQATVGTAGTYTLRVRGGGINSVQRYRLDVQAAVAPPLTLLLVSDVPENVAPGESLPVEAAITLVNETLVSATLNVSVGGGPFVATDLTVGDDGFFVGALPAAECGSDIAFFVSAVGASAGEITVPAAGPFVLGVEDPERFDGFEADTGWTAGLPGDTATTGQWQRATPQGTAAQPAGAFEGNLCFVTGAAAGGGLGSFDIDNGLTTLLSPIYDLSDRQSASVRYTRWYSNSTGADPFNDVFTVDVSDDGGATWVRLETVGPGGSQVSGGWFTVEFDIAQFVSLSNQVRFRFIASDLGNGSLVEAAVDNFTLTDLGCTEIVVPQCNPADIDADGQLTFADVTEFVAAFNAGSAEADLTGEGNVTFADVTAFVDAFNAGCP